MKIIQCDQGSTEWLQLRSGLPTSSHFSQIVTPTGKSSKSSEPLMLTLLAERLMGHPVAEHVSFYMKRGSELEIDAVRFYRLQTDSDTIPVGLILNDAGTIGTSPDQLVGDDGLLEIKCPSEHVHMAYLLTTQGAANAYKCQVQGQLWITGRQFCDVLSYHPELPPALHRVERDEAFIGILAELVTQFSNQLEELHQSVIDRGYTKTVKYQREKTLVEILKESLIEVNRESA